MYTLMLRLILFLALYPTFSFATFAKGVPGEFDTYVVSLSWSPEFCSQRPENPQCEKHYGFVLHGLWPQYNKGYPSFCSKEAFNPEMETQFAGLYPASNLYQHEWEKHGTCSGLSQAAYHQLSADLKAKIQLPEAYVGPVQPLRVSSEQLKAAFVASNPEFLSDDSIATFCADSGRFLREIFVCFDKTGEHSTSCPQDVQKSAKKSCGQADFLVRSVR